jgi:hypothetical protein
MRIAGIRKVILTAALAAAWVGPGCSGKQASSSAAPAQAVAPDTPRPPPPAEPTRGETDAEEAAAEKSDAKKQDQSDDAWTPAEYKVGMTRFKDTAVYVDGKPVGVLTFGELPVALKPVWVEDVVSAPKKPGEPGDGSRKVKQRYYRFTDYLRAVGIDPKQVKEIHVYGPRFSETIIASGADLASKEAKGFMFRFGGEVWGKPIPQVPEGFGNGKTPDKITAVMIYVEKKPPELVRNVGLVLDGQVQTNVPYYGEPLRGGIRLYLDDKMAVWLKRRVLAEQKADHGRKIFDILAEQGVDTSKIVEAYVIRGERREEKLSRAELENATLEASAQSKGELLLVSGGKQYRVQVLALHTRRLAAKELPVITGDEDPAFARRMGEDPAKKFGE